MQNNKIQKKIPNKKSYYRNNQMTYFNLRKSRKKKKMKSWKKKKKSNESTKVDSHLLKEEVNKSKRGMFLIIEGLEESGKSMLANKLVLYLT